MSPRSIAGYPPGVVAALADWVVKETDAGPAQFLLGLSGLQGSGKSTLAAQLVAAVAAQGIDALALSLDDVYLTRAERQALARDVHPLLATRGVPGTHDLALLHATFDALAHATPDAPAAVPRFDKGIDDRAAESAWTRVTRRPRLIVLEGWCVGVPPQTDEALRTPVNALERDEDGDGRWRHFVNAALADDYARLWAHLRRLVALLAPSFDVVRPWRDEQEQMLRDRGAEHAMPAGTIARFVSHFERIGRHSLVTLPQRADRCVMLDAARRVVRADDCAAPRWRTVV